MRPLLLAALILLTAAGAAQAEPVLRSGPGRVSLIELYTSEGCSSCPPAEDWMTGLRKNPDLWKRFVPIAFHVDYWDYLGWKDSFADAAFSDRQRRYAASWKSRSVYTPGFVLNGQERRGNPLSVLAQEEGGVLSLERDGRAFRVVYEPAAGKGPFIAHAALLGFGIVSNVKRGENAGRRLVHDFTVLDLKERAMLPRGGRHEAAVELLSGEGPGTESQGLAVWVTDESGREPLQAAGGYL